MRRLVSVLCVALSSLLVLGLTPTGSAAENFKGEALTVVTLDGAQSSAVEAVVPAFEKATGAKVQVQKFPWGSLLEKVMMDLSVGQGTFDVLVMTANQIGLYAEAGYIIPIDEFVHDPTIADPNLNLKDFSPALLDIASWKGKLYGLPFKPDMQLLYYRKDLFQNPKIKEQFRSFAGRELTVPTTTDEFLEVAEFFTKKYNPNSPTEYGTAVMAKKGNQTTFFWTPRLFSAGADLLTADLRPGFDNAAGVRALQYMLDVLKFCPPESATYDFSEANNAYLSGRVAMLEQWIEFAIYAETPSGPSGQSQVVGKTGYALLPGVAEGGKVRQVVNGSSWNSFITKSAKNKRLAYKFIEFLTFRDSELLKLPCGVMPCRKPTLSDPQLRKKYPFFEALVESWDNAKFCKPNLPESEELLDVLRTNFSAAATGSMTAEQAIHDAAQRWREILHRAGYW